MNRAGVTGVAQRIAASRLERKLTLVQVADQLGINSSWARNLEAHDDELPMTLSLHQVCRLAECFAVSPRSLVCGGECPNNHAAVAPDAIVNAIKAHLSANRLTANQFGEAVGWELQPVIDAAARIWSDWNLDQAHDVCESLGIDWRSLLPASIGK